MRFARDRVHATHGVLLTAALLLGACGEEPAAGDDEAGTGDESGTTGAETDTGTETDTGGETDTGETGEPGLEFCPAGEEMVEARIDALLAELDIDEKITLMAGESSLDPGDGVWRTPGVEAQDLPGLAMVDGPRGISAGAGNATAFPVGAARAASWDPELERRVGAAMGVEARAKGASVLLAPTVNVLRHPRWGRAQETYGEEPHLIAQMGAAFIEGVQAQKVVASIKHLAVNSLEDNRFTVDVQIDERALREVYLEAFELAVDRAKVASVMTAYNLMNGAYCAENKPLVRDILKDEWGFRGFVESDWVLGTRSTVPSLEAGLDIEMPSPMYYGNSLHIAAANGDADPALIDDAVRRIARVQWCFGLDSDPPALDPDAIESDAHLALAREVAEAGLTLLRNESVDGVPALPLAREAITQIVVLGELADVENIGDIGSSNVAPSEVVTVLEGLQAEAGEVEIVHVASAAPLSLEDAQLLADADAVVLVTGLTSEDEGEGLIAAGDREDMVLDPEQVALIDEAAALNPRTVVVLEGGSSLVVDPWYASVPAIVMAWYPGARGGEAIARVLFGDVDPGGRSPVTWPVQEADLPSFENQGETASYDLWHGYRLLERTDTQPRFAFGHGLSYTDFEVEGLALSHEAGDDELWATVTVRNVGERPGRTVVQVYVGQLDPPVERSERELEAFAAVSLDVGESVELAFEIPARALSIWDAGWVRPAGDYRVWVGQSLADLPLQADIELP